MPDLRRVHDSAGELRFAHRPGGGWLLAAVGGVLAWLGVARMDGGSGLFVIGLGALLVYAGISGALYRLELTFDLQRRHYRYRRGHLPRLETGEGSFDDIERVVLEKELERRGSDRVDEWEVKLVLRGWPRPIEVLETRDEAPARREAEALAARLGVPLEERTGY